MTYVVLDPSLQQADPGRFDTLFAQFARGYAKHFSGDEAESTGEWRARINGKTPPQPVMRIVVAVERVNDEERVVGGLAAEHYRHAACVLATYLYVDEAYRGRRYARDLLKTAGEAFSTETFEPVMLAEVEWPGLLSTATAKNEARRRLCFFARLRARMLQLDYVQPALGVGKQPVRHLRLFWLPPPSRRRPADRELAATVSAFLEEFYEALAAENGGSFDTKTLAHMQLQLVDRKGRPLTVPLPRLRLTQAAVCLHFVEALSDTKRTTAFLSGVRQYQCRVLHSMETDLLSRAYRVPGRRLFRTVCMTKPLDPEPADGDAGLEVEIEFPSWVTFRSENREEERHWPLRQRLVRAYLAPSIFLDARLIVWHLTLRVDERLASDGDPRRWFDEQDVVALLKLTDDEADQEFLEVPVGGPEAARRITKNITFRLGDGDRPALDVAGLLQAVAAITHDHIQRVEGVDPPVPHHVAAPIAATVELLGWRVDGAKPWAGVRDPSRREALCGIVTGILDFDRIDRAEARDTLTPSVELADALLRVHRERVVYVAEDDRAARTVAGSVGISPYLILPHAAALCDDGLLQPFESTRDTDPGSVRELSVAVGRREDALRKKWVPNPFFYPTEQRLFEHALVEGGTAARRAKEEERLLELKTRLQLAIDTQRAKFEALVQALLAAITAVSVDTLAVDFIGWLRGPASPAYDKVLGHGLTLALALFCSLFIYLWKLPPGDRGPGKPARRSRRRR
jgi:GNAT superfamily N-acetyltransferase